jgi:predicted HAD superfamily Cof-like phosphohydrolase
MSQAQQVREFTTESNPDIKYPTRPTPLNLAETKFIVRMIMSELDELITTVTSSSDERDSVMMECVNTRDRCNKFDYKTKNELLAAQYDAFVDSHYYSLNCAAKKGVNLDSIFKVVHDANMRKRDTKTGKFIRRDDGKIQKPEGWCEPDIIGEIARQLKDGAF